MALAGLLDCPICITTLSDPRILPCGHSLCGPQSENRCLVQLEMRQQRRGEIVCPECQRSHQTLAENLPPPYGFRDLLQRSNQLRLCQRHDSELRYFCEEHGEELCDDCWSEEHLGHAVELLKINKWKRLSSPWENRRIQELRAFCLENVECLNKGVDCLVEQRNRYQKTADLCLSLMQNETRMNQQFQRKQVDPNDQSVIEFELYIQHLSEETSKLDRDMAKLGQLTEDLKLMITRTANELKKRVAINSTIKQEERERKKVEKTSRLAVPSPTEAIIAFGHYGKNQILRSGKNKWEEWEGRNCGRGFATVRVNKNIFIIGGSRIFAPSTCTDIYNTVTKTWSKGPKLNISRYDAAACFDAVNNHVYVIGGFNDEDKQLNSVERLNVTSEGQPVGGWQFGLPMKSRRVGCAAAVVNDKLFVSGGRTETKLTTASMECLHLPTGQWSECRSINDKRFGHAMIAFNDEIIVFGGANDIKHLSSAEKYCPVNQTWKRVASMTVARNSCGVALFNERIHLVGGWCDYDSGTIVEIYDPESNSWSEGPRLTKGGPVSCVSW